jgi:hypothetical protein
VSERSLARRAPLLLIAMAPRKTLQRELKSLLQHYKRVKNLAERLRNESSLIKIVENMTTPNAHGCGAGGPGRRRA